MNLIGSKGQVRRDNVFNASGNITSGAAPQLLLPEHPSRSYFQFQNLSSAVMWLEFGSARGTATLTSGVVTSVSVTAGASNNNNPGFGFTYPPIVTFLGGAEISNSEQKTPGQPGYPSPDNVARAAAVLSGTAIGSIAVQNGGKGYVNAPYVFIQNNQLDPFGCADPSANSGSGFQIPANGGSILFNGTFCPTDPIAVFCATISAAFTCMWSV